MINFDGLKRLIAKQNTASTRLRLMFVDEAMRTAYNESLYDEGYEWLIEAIEACESLEEVKAELTDANFHDAVKALL